MNNNIFEVVLECIPEDKVDDREFMEGIISDIRNGVIFSNSKIEEIVDFVYNYRNYSGYMAKIGEMTNSGIRKRVQSDIETMQRDESKKSDEEAVEDVVLGDDSDSKNKLSSADLKEIHKLAIKTGTFENEVKEYFEKLVNEDGLSDEVKSLRVQANVNDEERVKYLEAEINNLKQNKKIDVVDNRDSVIGALRKIDGEMDFYEMSDQEISEYITQYDLGTKVVNQQLMDIDMRLNAVTLELNSVRDYVEYNLDNPELLTPNEKIQFREFKTAIHTNSMDDKMLSSIEKIVDKEIDVNRNAIESVQLSDKDREDIRILQDVFKSLNYDRDKVSNCTLSQLNDDLIANNRVYQAGQIAKMNLDEERFKQLCAFDTRGRLEQLEKTKKDIENAKAKFKMVDKLKNQKKVLTEKKKQLEAVDKQIELHKSVIDKINCKKNYRDIYENYYTLVNDISDKVIKHMRDQKVTDAQMKDPNFVDSVIKGYLRNEDNDFDSNRFKFIDDSEALKNDKDIDCNKMKKELIEDIRKKVGANKEKRAQANDFKLKWLKKLAIGGLGLGLGVTLAVVANSSFGASIAVTGARVLVPKLVNSKAVQNSSVVKVIKKGSAEFMEKHPKIHSFVNGVRKAITKDDVKCFANGFVVGYVGGTIANRLGVFDKVQDFFHGDFQSVGANTQEVGTKVIDVVAGEGDKYDFSGIEEGYRTSKNAISGSKAVSLDTDFGKGSVIRRFMDNEGNAYTGSLKDILKETGKDISEFSADLAKNGGDYAWVPAEDTLVEVSRSLRR